jgi:large exoprotein involved in heme utilization and adhesion
LIAHDRLRLSNGGGISAESIRSDGGNIAIRAGNAVEMFASSITAEVGIEAGAEATGGNISIDPTWVLLENGSVISANAHAGNGGNVSIRTQGLFVSPDSRISASSALGIDGTVEVDAPETNLTGELAQLSQSYLDAASLIGDRCGAAGRAQGSFALRDGVVIPLPPDAALASPLLHPLGNELARAR